MLRIYPAMDLLAGRVVRLQRGAYDAVTVYPHEPVATAAGYARDGAERVHLVDLDGARDGRPTQAALVRAVLAAMPGAKAQVGGGIRTLAQAEGYLEAGAERVVLGTAAVKNPAFVREACARFPVVIAVDARDGYVATEGWTEASQVRADELCLRARDLGARAVLFTNISRDGTGEGPDVEATAALAEAVPELEVIASGGVGSVAHLAALARRPAIGACVLGRALYSGALTLADARRAVRDAKAP